MINLYRVVRYPDHTRLTFQGDSEDIDKLGDILHFDPKPSKRQDLYEKGYFAYLRGPYREKSEREALSYLAEHFRPPLVELSLFVGDQPLPSDRPHNEWASSLECAIRQYFSDKGYLVAQGGLAHEVYSKRSKQPDSRFPELEIHEGVTYRIHVGPDFVPILQADIIYRFTIDGNPVKLKDIQARFGAQTDVIARLKDFTTRDMNGIFELIQRFIKSIPATENAGGCCFKHEPLTAQSLGFDTWFWEHDFPVHLEVGKGEKVPLAQHISEYNLGFYIEPPDPVIVLILHPAQGVSRWCPFSNWRSIYDIAQSSLAGMLGTDVPIRSLEYPVDEKDDELVIQACKATLQEFVDRTPLFLVVVPPEDSRDTGDTQLSALDSFTFRLAKNLRRMRRGSYVITLNWDKLALENDRPYIVENGLLKGLIVLGAVPWRLSDIAHVGTDLDNLCFIGVDVNIKRRIPVVGGVVLDRYGVLRGSHLVRLESVNGDRIDVESFSLLVDKLLKHYRAATGMTPHHLVIHRDGILFDEEKQVLEVAAKTDTVCDLVEVRKSGAPRIRQPMNTAGTPSKDIAVGNEEQGIAYLVNTLSFAERLTTDKFVFPAPESVMVQRVAGKTPMKILAAQVHALTRVHYGSYRRTERIPATIAYADALVSHAPLRDNQKDFGKPIDSRTRPFWL